MFQYFRCIYFLIFMVLGLGSWFVFLGYLFFEVWDVDLQLLIEYFDVA